MCIYSDSQKLVTNPESLNLSLDMRLCQPMGQLKKVDRSSYLGKGRNKSDQLKLKLWGWREVLRG